MVDFHTIYLHRSWLKNSFTTNSYFNVSLVFVKVNENNILITNFTLLYQDSIVCDRRFDPMN